MKPQIVGPDQVVVSSVDREMFGVVNLFTTDTGVAGTIFISTAMGQHGPRMSFPGRPTCDGPCSHA